MLWLALRVVSIVYTSGCGGFEYRFDVLELVSVLQRRLAEAGHARTRFGEVDAVLRVWFRRRTSSRLML
jgi:hypothetical protein